MQILIAEDNPVNQKLLELICRQAGYNIRIADNGAAAVNAVCEGGIDLVLMDIMMPVMDGLEATQRIRGLSGPAGRIPIIAVSAYTSQENRDQCRSVGIDAFVSKPIRPAELMTIITEMLTLSRLAEGEAAAPEPVTGAVL